MISASKILSQILIFSILFSFCITIVVHYGTQDKEFAISDLQTNSQNVSSKISWNPFGDFLIFWKQLIWEGGGKTNSGEGVYSYLSKRFFPTIVLASFTILWSFFLSMFLSLELTSRNLLFWDAIFRNISNSILSIPIFIVAVLLLILFFYEWSLLPPGGYEPGRIEYLILPSIALGTRSFSRFYLFMSDKAQRFWRNEFFENMRFLLFPRSVLVYKNLFLYLVPSSLLLALLEFSSLLGGAMIVEEIFFFPGMGRSLFQSIKLMDANLLGVLLLYSGILFYSSLLISRFLESLFWEKGQ